VPGRRALIGLAVADHDGRPLGTVVDTYPFDGGGEPELAVLRLGGRGAIGERRMVPVPDLRPDGDGLVLPYRRWQVEDSPAFGESRHSADDPERARSYWSWEEPAGTLPARCLRSSGSFATAKQCPTSPSPTPTAS
jgi:hypothetical protein